MKYLNIFRIIASVLVAVVVSFPIPGTPALAAPAFTLSTTQSSVGQTVSISGTGFYGAAANEINPRGVNILFVKSNPNTSLGTIDYTNAVYENVGVGGAVELRNGAFSSTFTVPSKLTSGVTDEDVVKGTYYIYITYFDPTAPSDGRNNPYILLSQAFNVVSGSISITPAGGMVGSQISVNGSSFGASEGFTIKFDDIILNISGVNTTDSNGAFGVATVTVPPKVAGQHTVTVSGNITSIKATATFALLPDIILTPPSGVSGGVLSIKGSGFAGSTGVTTKFDNETSVSATTDTLGGFTASLVIPVRAPGNYNVNSLDSAGNADGATFSVIAGTISLSQSSGIAGSAASISGGGLLPAHSIAITFGTTKVAAVNSDAQGNYSADFTVPELAAGSYEVKATDSINTSKINFTITAAAPSTEPTPVPTPNPTTPTPVPPAPSADVTPPAIPAPLKPEMGLKASPRTFFKWLEVTDPNRVTYTLQVATDREFPASAVVLEKTELNDTKYTLTRQEELSPPEKDIVYYWRIKAVDGKGNESPWSGIGEFTVGSRFNLTQPQIYLGIGIGALVLVIFAFWLGRRTSYY